MVLQPKHLQRFPPFDQPEKIDDLRDRIEKVRGHRMRGGMSGRPCFELEDLVRDPNAFDAIRSVTEWIFEQIREHDV